MFLSENLIHPRGCFLSLDLFAFPLMEVPQKSQTIKFIQYYDCKQFKIIVITATTTLEADEMKVFVAAIDAVSSSRLSSVFNLLLSRCMMLLGDMSF